MKCYFVFEGSIPSGVTVVREGAITRIYFDWEKVTKTIDGVEMEELCCENVDVTNLERGHIISAIVRDRYPQDRVEAILANGSDTPAHQEELEAFQAWRTKAKSVADDVLAAIE